MFFPAANNSGTLSLCVMTKQIVLIFAWRDLGTDLDRDSSPFEASKDN